MTPLQVRSQVPWLANVLRLLQETLELAQDLIDKVRASYVICKICSCHPRLPLPFFWYRLKYLKWWVSPKGCEDVAIAPNMASVILDHNSHRLQCTVVITRHREKKETVYRYCRHRCRDWLTIIICYDTCAL